MLYVKLRLQCVELYRSILKIKKLSISPVDDPSIPAAGPYIENDTEICYTKECLTMGVKLY